MELNGNTAMMNPGQPQMAAPMPEARHGIKGSTIAKILPTAVLSGLYLKGSGGLSGLSHMLSGGNLKSAAGGVASGAMQRQAKGTINPQLADNLVNKLGFNDFNDVPRVADVGIPAINNEMEGSLQRNEGSVDLGDYKKMAQDYMDKDLSITEPMRKRINGVMDRFNMTPAAVLGVNGQPNRVESLKELRVMDSMKSKAYSAWQSSVRSGKPDEEQHAVYNLLRQITKGNTDPTQGVIDPSSIEGRIFTDEKGAPLPLDDMSKSEMIAQLGPLKEALPDVYNNMSAQIRGSRNLIEARHLMADLTQGSIAHDKMSYAGGGGGMGSNMSDLAHGPLGIPTAIFAGTKSPLDALSGALMQSHGANVGITSLLSKLAS